MAKQMRRGSPALRLRQRQLTDTSRFFVYCFLTRDHRRMFLLFHLVTDQSLGCSLPLYPRTLP